MSKLWRKRGNGESGSKTQGIVFRIFGYGEKYGECCYQCLDIVDKLYEMACLELESKHRAKSQSMYLKELYKLNAPQQIEDGRKSKKVTIVFLQLILPIHCHMTN